MSLFPQHVPAYSLSDVSLLQYKRVDWVRIFDKEGLFVAESLSAFSVLSAVLRLMCS